MEIPLSKGQLSSPLLQEISVSQQLEMPALTFDCFGEPQYEIHYPILLFPIKCISPCLIDVSISALNIFQIA